MATVFSLSRLITSFRTLLSALAAGAASSTRPAGEASTPGTPAGPNAPERPATPPGSAPRRPVWHGPVRHAFKPLRVVRVLEPSAPRSTAGRMVISGRLADVCAELDRLAALEARHC